MADQAIVGFNSNDYFYVSAMSSDLMPSNERCNVIKNEANENKYTLESGKTVNFDFNINCDNLANEGIAQGDDSVRNGLPCIHRELCKNKEYATRIQKKQNNHSGSQEKYSDSLDKFYFTILNTANLSLGIGLIIFLIYKTNK